MFHFELIRVSLVGPDVWVTILLAFICFLMGYVVAYILYEF